MRLADDYELFYVFRLNSDFKNNDIDMYKKTYNNSKPFIDKIIETIFDYGICTYNMITDMKCIDNPSATGKRIQLLIYFDIPIKYSKMLPDDYVINLEEKIYDTI